MKTSTSTAVRGAAPALQGARGPAHGSRGARTQTLDRTGPRRHHRTKLSGNVAR